MKKRTFRISVFVPHKGCPHDCVFCNQKKITGQTEEMTIEKAEEIICDHLSTIESRHHRSDYVVEIAFFGGSFTAIERETMTALLSLAHSFVADGRVDGIRCSTRPDCIDEEILSLCKSLSMTAIELGVQSADEEVLLKSGRGHTFEDTQKAAKLIKEFGFELGLQMMTCLPGDTREKSLETARKIASLGPRAVRIYPTLVMEGTHLWDMYTSGIYTPQTLEEAVSLVAEIVPIFRKSDIEILRIGLQTTDNVNENTVVGPYHNAFAELVYGRIARDKIENYIIENGFVDSVVEITVPKGETSQYIGHKRANVRYFKEKYNVDLKIC